MPPVKEFTITYKHPNLHPDFDGTPFEAAAASVEQALQVTKLLSTALADTDTQLRNAHMQRGWIQYRDPDPITYTGTPEYATIVTMQETIEDMQDKLRALKVAALHAPARRKKAAVPDPNET